jgi:colanic acid biosynthesis glycosyl transferase WcaI
VPTASSLPSILFITQRFPPEPGAEPTRVDELCSRWQAAGHDVTVLTTVPDHPEGEIHDGYTNGWLQRETRNGVTVITVKTIPSPTGNLARRALKFVWFMLLATVVGLRLARRDIVVATSPQPLTGVSAWIVARLKRSRFVFEVRDLWPESITSLTDASTRMLKPLEWTVEFIYRRADRIVTVSRAFESDLIAAGVDSADIWFHPNGVTPEFFDRPSEEFVIDADLAEDLADQFVVSYVGTIGRAHGLSVVLDAADVLADNTDIQFLLVGHGAEADALKQEAHQRNLDNITFVGYRPKEEVPDFLALSDVSLVHLRGVDLFQTVIPSKMFESMGAGVPIALGVEGEAKRILKNSEAGLCFKPENATALASVITELHENGERREQLGENGRRFVAEEFSWDSIAAEYSGHLTSIA